MDNLANKITIFRITLVPWVIAISAITKLEIDFYNYISAAILVIFGLGDILDGYVARKYDQITTLGAFLDPFADKYMVISCCMILVHYGRLPFWYLLLIFNKDIFVFAGWIAVYFKTDKPHLASNALGKISMVFQVFIIFIAYLNADAKMILYLVILSAVITCLAGALYVLQGLKLAGEHDKRLD